MARPRIVTAVFVPFTGLVDPCKLVLAIYASSTSVFLIEDEDLRIYPRLPVKIWPGRLKDRRVSKIRSERTPSG